MSSRRLKTIVLLTGIALSGIEFIAWTQEWFSIAIDNGRVLLIAGDIAAPAVSTLALTNLVLIGALSIAGPVFRAILGVLQSLLGVTIVLSGVIALTNPQRASSAAITEATGVSGALSIADLVTTVSVTAWPLISIIAGMLLVALGAVVVITSRAWPQSSRKYSAVRTEAAAATTRVDDWDALSAGNDPT